VLSNQCGSPTLALAAAGNEAQVESPAAKPVSLLQFLARGDPADGDDEGALSLSLRNVEDLSFERGIDIYHETVRLW
jgi:hypothetical protein